VVQQRAFTVKSSETNNFQRIGAVSNTRVGSDFEAIARSILFSAGIVVEPRFSIPIGIGPFKKGHAFDLGASIPKILVECKSHRWTTGGNMPSAKMTVWNEAMYYFALAPEDYRKILFVLRDYSASRGETLAQYYVRRHRHLIPADVEIWEYDELSKKAEPLAIARIPT